jgi:hypothetical protein
MSLIALSLALAMGILIRGEVALGQRSTTITEPLGGQPARGPSHR